MKSLRSGLKVLRVLAEVDEPIGVTDIARRFGADKATIHRMLSALVDEGFAERDAGTRRYSLGVGVVELATERLRKVNLASFAVPRMEALRDELNETVALMIPEGRRLACAAVCESRQMVRVSFFVGERIPVFGSASGMAWLASQPRAERTRLVGAWTATAGAERKPAIEAEIARTISLGYAYAQNVSPEAGAVAAALVDNAGRCIGVVVLAAQSANLAAERVARIGPLLTSTVAQIRADWLGDRPTSIHRII